MKQTCLFIVLPERNSHIFVIHNQSRQRTVSLSGLKLFSNENIY